MLDVSTPERPAELEILVPPELEGGVYANALHAWHTEHEFTLDFCASRFPSDEPEDQEGATLMRSRVVSRVRIPVTFVFEVIRIANDEMTRYEARLSEIRRPGEGR